MKASDVVYVVIAALLRLAAVFVLLYGIFMALMPLLMGAGGAGIFMVKLFVALLLGALVLWLLAKPIAGLVVSGLDEPRV
jgi:hypothetical protein